MIKIAHRGNTQGPNPEKENLPAYILDSIDKGFDCEIDLWLIENEIFLGHDQPDYKINEKFLFEFASKLWVHCKNLEALGFVTSTEGTINGFWHQEDDYTLTTNGHIWTYPTRATIEQCILVHLPPWEISNFQGRLKGICSDHLNQD